MPKPDPRPNARCIAAAICLLALLGCDRGERPGQLGQAAPVFNISDGQHAVDLASLRGHVVLLNFWASWCPPCLEEWPSLNALQREFPDARIVGVSIDGDASAYQRFLVRHPADFLTVQDAAQRSNALYGTFRPPETYLIDKQGMVRRKFIGPQDWTGDEIVDYLKKLSK